MKIKSDFKILISLLLAVAMLTSCFCAFAEEASEEAAPKTPVSTSEYAFLDAMGMLSQGKVLYSEDNITRADFSYVIARFAGYKGGTYKASKSFLDVDASAYYSHAVNYLYDMDIVRGSDYRIFEPDTEITFNEMAKLAVRALGYEEIAFAKYGDSPLCYVRMADFLDLFDGVDMGIGTDSVPTEQAVIFLKNTALAATAQVEVFGGDTSEFVFDAKNTLLYVNYGIAYDEGVVYDNGLTSITGPSALKAGGAVIGDITLRKTKGEFDITGYIGMYVDFYYDEDEEMLIYAEASGNGNVLTLTYNQLAVNDSSFSHTNVVYYNENDKVKNARVSMNASMIYNGVAYPGYSLAQLKIKSGYMTLIDNGSDKVYDIITVVEYDDRYLTSYDVNSNMLYTEGGTIRLDDYKNVVITDHNGKLSEISKLAGRNILSVVASKDNTSIRIIDCAFISFKGTVTAADDDYFYIDEKP
ncbi:MAG: S-layer homology domain-containing protein [Clostridia bacterium]|nr:S-layer homology domain-containing protein [Clostridia bacterium]